MKLILGANTRQQEGWVHHDIQNLPGIDICCNFWDLPKHVEAGSCEKIQMTHMLEHFPMKDVHGVLMLVNTLLKRGGELYLEVPNFYWHALEIASDPTNRQIVEYAYGGQLNEWDFHYNGFTPEILTEDIENAGFKIKEMNPNSSIEVYCEKV